MLSKKTNFVGRWPAVGLFIACLIVWGGNALSFASENETVARRLFSLKLDHFETQGEVTYPATGDGPFPTVILVHGSGPMDMDHSVVEYDVATGEMTVNSAIFWDIATFLSESGFAVVRYNKRFVTSATEVDYVAYMHVDLPALAADVRKVVEWAKKEPLVDEKALFLYGWSEGSTVAAEVAATDSDLAGLILQTPVVRGWRETFAYQLKDVGLSYLRQVTGGKPVTAQTIIDILADEDAGFVAKSIANYIADGAAYQQGRIKVNSMLDADGDGTLDIDAEIEPNLDMLLDFAFSPFGPFGVYAEGRALPVLKDQVERLSLPILILQGMQDANVPADDARLLARLLEEAGTDVTLHMYDGLGHSLGPAISPLQDNFAPIVAEPLEDVRQWLEAR